MAFEIKKKQLYERIHINVCIWTCIILLNISQKICKNLSPKNHNLINGYRYFIIRIFAFLNLFYFLYYTSAGRRKQKKKLTQRAIKNKKHRIPTTLNWHFFFLKKKPSTFPTHNSTVNAVLNNGFHTFSCEWSLEGDEGKGEKRNREGRKGERRQAVRGREGGQAQACHGLQQCGNQLHRIAEGRKQRTGKGR